MPLDLLAAYGAGVQLDVEGLGDTSPVVSTAR
jgi:hypothetical protein